MTALGESERLRTVHQAYAPLQNPPAPSTQAVLRHPDQEKLHETILTLRTQGMSYREIGREVGLHFTRVGQILQQDDKHGRTPD